MDKTLEVWVITWEYSDKSAFGIVGDIASFGIVGDTAYEDWNAATHIAQTLKDQCTGQLFKVVKLGLVTGALQ